MKGQIVVLPFPFTVTFGGLPSGGVGTHYLVRSDPMAWLPVRRKGKVIKMGKLGFSISGHDPKTYLAELAKLE